MERVYLLLRNNQQSGPFTIGELLQQKLSSSDMIWIEGKSTAWTYLTELELNPHIETPKEFDQVQLLRTSDEIEKKAEELRQRILSAPPRTYFPNHKVQIETYASPYKLDDEVQFIDHGKEGRAKKNTALAELLLTCFVIGLFMMGIFKGRSFIGARQKIQDSVATQLNSGDQHTARVNAEPSQVGFSIVDSTKKTDSLLASQKTKQKYSQDKKIVDSLTAGIVKPQNITPVNPQDKEEANVIQTSPQDSNEAITKKNENAPVKKEIIASVPGAKTSSEPVKEEKEKKGFLRGLFKKKKDKAE